MNLLTRAGLCVALTMIGLGGRAVSAAVLFEDGFERADGRRFIAPAGPWDNDTLTAANGGISEAAARTGDKGWALTTVNASSARRLVWLADGGTASTATRFQFDVQLLPDSVAFEGASPAQLLRVQLGDPAAGSLNGADAELAVELLAGTQADEYRLRLRARDDTNTDAGKLYTDYAIVTAGAWYQVSVSHVVADAGAANGVLQLVVRGYDADGQLLPTPVLDETLGHVDNSLQSQIDSVWFGLPVRGSLTEGAFYFDNFEVGVIPEPAAAMMLGAGLLLALRRP